jgi:osmoprotectant transport system ATP-binding protein
MLEVRGVSKRYGDVVALDGVSLRVEAGRTCALIGPSGCGKTTLLRIMIGLVSPDAGEVLVGDRALTSASLRDARRRMGYAIQSGGLFPHMTARRNVETPGLLTGWERERISDRVSALAELVHLDSGMLDRYPSELSGGQRQRVALARALLLDPEVLLLDEPLGALDPMIRAGLQRELKEIFDGLGKAVVLVTHDLAEAAYLAAEDIVLLRRGRVESRGSFAGLRRAEEGSFARRFVEAQTERLAGLVG